MFTQKNKKNISLYRENRLVHLNLGTLFNFKKGPKQVNDDVLNPHDSIAEFEAEEGALAAKAHQNPLQDMVRNDVDDTKAMAHAALYPAQGALNVAKTIVNETSKSVSQILGTWVPNPIKIATRKIAAPISLVSNIVYRAVAAVVKLPASTVNILGSQINKVPLNVSAKAREGSEKVESIGSRFKNKIENVQTSLRSKIDNLQVPGLNALQPAGA
jgi:hypothetical protein